MGKGSGKGRFLNVWQELDASQQVVILLTCCIGPALMIAGIVLIVTNATPTRETAVATYDSAITNFTTASQTFRSLTVSWDGVNFQSNTDPDILNDPGTFPSYTTIKFMGSIPLVNLSQGVFVNFGNQLVYLDTSSPTLDQFTATPSTLNCRTTTTNPCQETTSSSCISQPYCSDLCSSINGVWNSAASSCSGTQYLNEICFRVSQPFGDSWVTDIRGCYYNGKDSPTSLGNVDPAVDPLSQAIYGPINKGDISVVLRHVADPYIVASVETFGTFYFGLSVLQKTTPGIICLCVGFGFQLIDIAGVLIYLWWTQTAGRGRKGKIRNGGFESNKPSATAEMEENLMPKPKPKHAPGHESYNHSIKPITHIIPIYPLDQTPSRTESSAPVD